jgi:hypothetical protein
VLGLAPRRGRPAEQPRRASRPDPLCPLCKVPCWLPLPDDQPASHPPDPFGVAAAGQTPALTPATRRRGLWVPVLVVLFVVLAAAAVLVHLVVVPLPVAAVWFQPATLLIESQPAGAEVVLDGSEASIAHAHARCRCAGIWPCTRSSCAGTDS